MRIKVDVTDGKNVFFISDFHLYHKNVIGFDNRPFRKENGAPDIELMHKTILDNWNKVVKENDIVFYLGDLCFGRPELANNIIYGLKGTIHYIMGNHDRYKDIAGYNRFESINDYVDLNITKQNLSFNFALMHYPIYSWNRAHHGSYMIHGHTHMSLSNNEFHKNQRIFDVGCNGWNYTPVAYTTIIEKGDKINYKITSQHH